MKSVIITKTYEAPPFCEREAFRYAGCKEADENIIELLNACKAEVWEKLTYKVCYCELQMTAEDKFCDFGIFQTKSLALLKNLKGCESVILFSATVGLEIDRLLAKYGRISPAKALVLQAIGTERIESLCDAFCEDIKIEKNVGLRPRFSPGYGDLSLDVQREISRVLNFSKNIGVTLNDSLVLSPTKSVTAFVGITDKTDILEAKKCVYCEKQDCVFKEV